MFKKSLLLTLLLALFVPWAANAYNHQVQVGNGTSGQNIAPINLYYNYSYTQQIYTAAQINGDCSLPGTIESISFYYAGSVTKTHPITVFMKTTEKTSFSDNSDWETVTESDIVYNDSWTVSTAGWVTITLNEPFAYDGESNLLIAIDKGYGDSYSNQNFRYTAVTNNQVIQFRNDSTDPDPYSPTAATGTSANLPNILFNMTIAHPAPSALTLGEVAINTATISWTAPQTTNTITGYAYEYTDGETIETGTATGTTANLTGLTAATDYLFQVKAVYGDSESCWSEALDFTTMEACMTPENLTITNVTAHTADLTWTEGFGDGQWVLQYKLSTETEYTNSVNVALADLPYTLTGLTAESTYNVLIAPVCDDTKTLTGNFTTTVACFAPTNLAVEANVQTATFTWESDVNDYEIAYATEATADPNDNIVGTATENTYSMSNLTIDANHYFWVRSNCGSEGYSSWAGPASVHIGYCVPNPSSHDGKGITGVSFGTGDYIVTNGDGSASLPASAPFYGDYSSMIGAVQAGVESTIAITTSTGSYPYTFVIWVDFDNSLSFEDSEILYVGKATSGAGTLNATITVPATQTLGDYRMRIYGADSYFTSFYNSGNTNWEAAHDPCSSGSYRHAHDYTLRVLEAPSCLTPTGLTASDVTAHEATISWTSDASAWEIQLDEEEAIEVTEATYTFTGLTAETEYSVKVRTNCSGTYSDWTNAISFTTTIACPAPTGLAFTLTSGDGTVATFSWTENGSATAWQLCINGDEDNLIDMDENPFTYNGFTPEETYTAKVRAVCGGIDGESAWSNTVTFTPSNANTITVNDSTATNSYVPVYGTWVDSYTKCQFIIPASELEAMQWGTISKMTFYSSTQNKTWGAAEFDILLAEVNNTTFESATLVDWSSMEQVYHGAVSVSDYKMEIVFDNDYQYMGGNLLVGFHQTVKGTYGGVSWYGVSSTNSAIGGYENNAKSLSLQSFLPKTTFDYVPGEAPACLKPTNLSVNYEGGITATVTWEGTATSYNIDVNGTVTEGVTSPYALEDLDMATTYAVMVQADCGDNGTSEWTSAVSFTTDLCLPENMCEIGIELTDAYGDGGGQIQVVDALTGEVLGTYTNSSASTSYTLAVCDGRELNFVYTNTDSYAYENGFVFTDVNGEVIAEHVGCSSSGCTPPTNGVVATYTVDCFPCAKPTNLAAEIQNYTSANLSWDGTNDSYNLRYREVVFADNFENGFANWNVIDADGDGYGFVLGSESGGIYHNVGVDLTGQGHNGSNDMILSASYSNNLYNETGNGALTPDNYMISPKLELGQTFSFWAQAQDASYPAEHFGVAVSTTVNDDPNAFSIIDEWTLTAKGMSAKANPATTRSGENLRGGNWYQYTVDLSAYAGEEGYIAIRHFDCTDQFILNLDDVTYGPAADEGWTVVEGLASIEYLLENLNEHTNYEFQLQGVCGTDDQTDWTSSAYFSTLADEPQAVIDGGAWNNPNTWVNSGNQVPEPDQNVTVLGDVVITANLEVTGEITIADGATLTVEEGVVFNAGEINVTSPDQLIIGSGAQFMHTGDVPATVTFNYSATGAKDDYGIYRLIASPITPYVTVNATGLVPASTDANYKYVDLYSFNQDSINEWINYKHVENHFTTIDVAKGYLYANRQAIQSTFAGLTLSTSNNKVVTLDYTGGAEFAGLNLVGNPYTCNAYVKNGSNEYRSYYVLKASGEGLDATPVAGSTPVAPMQGLFVLATDTDNTCTFTTTAPTKSSNLNITVSQANAMVDNAILSFGNGSSLEKLQLNPNRTKVYMPVEGKDYAVAKAENEGEMPVYFKAQENGNYTISFNSEEVSFNYLHLIDNLTGNDVDLLDNPSYSFDARTTDYASRFKLVFATGNTNGNVSNFGFISDGNLMILGIEGEATLQIIDVTGRILSTETFSGSYTKAVNEATGVYMLRLIQGSDVRTQKIVIK